MTTRASQELENDVRRALQVDDVQAASSLLASQSPDDVTALMDRLNLAQRAVVYRTLPKDTAVQVFDRLDPALQADLISGLRGEDVTSVFAAMEPDDRPASVATRLLEGLAPDERQLTGIVLGYPEDSIVRRMSPEFVALHPELRVDEALAAVRRRLDDAESIYTLPVIGERRRLVGVVSLRQLLRAETDTLVGDLLQDADTAEATELAEVAARRCADRQRLALPIVDKEARLVGLLTVDDALAILEEAESEDHARMSGSEPLRRAYLATPVAELVRSRVVWLLVLAIGATLTVQVLESFEDTIAQLVVLSVFVPLLIGTGGNTGNQAATTVTRALALGDVHPGDVGKVLLREVRVGASLGLLLGLLGCGIASIFYGFAIGAVIGLTLLSICTLAATVGGGMPLLARRFGIDPAVFANPFITTLVDATGLVIYFLIAKAVLGL